MAGISNMKTFLQFVGKKQFRKEINEEEGKCYEDLPCYIDITANSFPEDDPKLNDFLKSLNAFVDKWLYDWKKKHPND